MNRVWRGAGQLLVGLVVFAALAVVLGISLAHRGDGGNPASAHVHRPSSTASPSPSPSPSSTPEPSPTPRPATPAPTPVPTPSGSAQLTFSGAVTGTMPTATVSCGTHIPEGDGGVMQVTGQVAGSTWQVQIWSTGPAPGKLQYIQLWHGTPVGGGTIDFQNSVLSGGTLAGISRFDWARGATLDDSLTDFTNAGRPPVHIAGTIVCPVPAPA